MAFGCVSFWSASRCSRLRCPELSRTLGRERLTQAAQREPRAAPALGLAAVTRGVFVNQPSWEHGRTLVCVASKGAQFLRGASELTNTARSGVGSAATRDGEFDAIDDGASDAGGGGPRCESGAWREW
jgi:hypothetical protein